MRSAAAAARGSVRDAPRGGRDSAAAGGAGVRRGGAAGGAPHGASVLYTYSIF